MADYTLNIEASLPDVFILAGADTDPSVATQALDQAAATIEAISGVIFDAEFREVPVSVHDVAWIRKAVVFQAAWLIEQAGVFSRQSVSSLSQDGLSVNAMDELTFVLAPMAKRALNNCSWNRNGTLKVAPATTSRLEDFVTSDNHPWYPLGGV